MSEIVLLVLRLGFLVLLWGFVFAVILAVRRDLIGKKVPKETVSRAGAATFPRPVGYPAGTDEPAQTAVITDGPNTGKNIRLNRETLTIGRSPDSDLVIHDDYTSTHHARLLLSGGSWLLEDLDSTNGTFLNGQKVKGSVPVPSNTPVTIGNTTFELRS